MTEHEVARKFLSSTIGKGILPRAKTLMCADCGNPADEYHHHAGYEEEHWLDVVPLCRECHLARHHPQITNWDERRAKRQRNHGKVRLQFVVNIKYKLALEKIAARNGLSITAAFRQLILAEAQRRGLDLVDPEPEPELEVESNGSQLA